MLEVPIVLSTRESLSILPDAKGSDQDRQNKQGRRHCVTLLLAAQMEAEAGGQEVANRDVAADMSLYSSFMGCGSPIRPLTPEGLNDGISPTY